MDSKGVCRCSKSSSTFYLLPCIYIGHSCVAPLCECNSGRITYF